jgi:hypothetical protein
MQLGGDFEGKKLSVSVHPPSTGSGQASIPLKKQLFGSSKFNELRYRPQPPKTGQTASMDCRLFLAVRLAARVRGLLRTGRTEFPARRANGVPRS